MTKENGTKEQQCGNKRKSAEKEERKQSENGRKFQKVVAKRLRTTENNGRN